MKQLVLATLAMCIIALSATAQNKQIPLIGSEAPGFTAMSTNGSITFPNDFGKHWKILFSHPQDFTPVCSTELLEIAFLQPKLNKLGVKVAVISTDDVKTHKLWVQYLEQVNYKNRGHVDIQFPIIEDPGAVASVKYGMLHRPTSTNRDIRGVYILDENNIVRAINFYPIEVGRSMAEILRTIEALQKTQESFVYTPADWQKGDDVIIPYYPLPLENYSKDIQSKDGYYSVGDRLWFKVGEEVASKEE